jgi:hypothetical protein
MSTFIDKYCATCGVTWSSYGGFYHAVGCPQYMKQSDCEVLDRVDYTPPDYEQRRMMDEEDYEKAYNNGWDDAIKRVTDLLEDMAAKHAH